MHTPICYNMLKSRRKIWFLIPIMGIGGYAVVIVLMEGFNFTFSIKKLYTRLHFSIEFGKYFWLPLACALFSAVVCKKFFVMSGREADGLWLFLKIVFAVCMFIASYMTVKKAAESKRILKKQRKREKII